MQLARVKDTTQIVSSKQMHFANDFSGELCRGIGSVWCAKKVIKQILKLNNINIRNRQGKAGLAHRGFCIFFFCKNLQKDLVTHTIIATLPHSGA